MVPTARWGVNLLTLRPPFSDSRIMSERPCIPPWSRRDGFFLAAVVLAVAVGQHFLFLAPAWDEDLFVSDAQLQRMRPGGIWKTGVSSADQLEYAQLARQIWRGEGFTTKFIYPQTLVKVPELPHPNLARPPLYPLLVAGAYSVFGCNDVTPVLVSFLLYLAAAGLVYAFARRYCARWIAVLAALAFAAQPLVYVAGASALAGLLGAVLLTGAVWLILERRALFAAGVLFALAYLSRYHLLALTPFLAAAAGWPREGRWPRVIGFLAGFLLAASPWWIRNTLLTGSPLYSVISNELLHYTATYPEQTLYGQTEAVAPLRFALAHPGEMLAKGWRFLREGLAATGVQLGPLVLPLAVAGFAPVRARGLAVLAWVSLAVQLGMFATAHFEARYLVSALPLLFVAAGAGLQRLWPKRLAPAVAAPLVMALAVAQTFAMLAFARPDAYAYVYFNLRWLYPREVEYVRSETQPGDVIMTNVPWTVAWRCDRTAIYATHSPAALEAIENLEAVDLAAFYRSGSRPLLNEDAVLSSTAFRRLFYFKERRPDQGVFYARVPPREVWAEGLPNLAAWDAGAGEPVTLAALLEQETRWGEAIWRLRGAAKRARDLEMTPSGKGAAILLESGGVVGIGDAADVEEVMGYTDTVDLEFLGDGASGAILYRSGMMRVFGEARHHGYMLESGGIAKDFEFTRGGAGYLILNAHGRLEHCGETPAGNTPDFGAPFAADMEMSPDGRGWYVMDIHGAIHKSDPSLPDLLGPYDPSKPLAEDLILTGEGTGGVLTRSGTLAPVRPSGSPEPSTE